MAGKKNRPDRTPRLSDRLLDRIDKAWDELEKGNIDAASVEAEELMDVTGGHPEVRFLLGATLLESGYASDALEHLESSENLVENPNVHTFYLASAMLELARFDESEALFRQVMETEEDKTPVQYGLAQVLEHLGQYAEAEKHYEAAYRGDPESYPLPTRMRRNAFVKVVREAMDALPEELRVHLNDVPVVVQDLPEKGVLVDAEGEEVSPTVQGMFVGHTLRDRSVFSTPQVAPTIFIYQRNLERMCFSREELIHEIALTLYHELGHYLGLEEDELEARGLE
jgi:predicted Zn-dependent protease with MMP-like domain